MPKNYNCEILSNDNCVKACITNAQVSYKKTRETCNTLRGRTVEKAMEYLTNVIYKVECVPMRRFNRGCGNTRQARRFMNGSVVATKGRWPMKSCEYMLKVLRNIKNNALVKGLDIDNLYIKMVSITKAPRVYGRTFRAHGRVNAFNKAPCHIQVVAESATAEMAAGADVVEMKQ